jgi:S1-C subfamily serine protease
MRVNTVERKPGMTEARHPHDAPSPKLLSAASIKIRIAIVSGMLLPLGAWLTPSAVPTTLTTPPQEHAAPLLEEQVQLRETSRPFVGVQDVAAAAREHSVAIPGVEPPRIASWNDFSQSADTLPPPAGFGVFVSDRHVLTHSRALDGRSSVRLMLSADLNVDARVIAYERSTRLVLLETDASGQTPAAVAADAPPAGALAVAVGRSADGDVAVPVFVTQASGGRYTIAADNAILPGMPLFTLSGELFAVATPDEYQMRAVPVPGLVERLMARAASGERLSSLGIGLQPLQGLLTSAFGESGVVVTDVVEGGPADLADLRVGDVLVAFDGVQIDSIETATRQLNSAPPGTRTPLGVRRAGRIRQIEVTPALAYEVAVLAQRRPAAASLLEARTVFSPGVRERYAIPASSRVLGVNGRPVSSRAQVQRELRVARTPVAVLLQQGDNRFFIGIEPER